jgi:hypothetical protein
MCRLHQLWCVARSVVYTPQQQGGWCPNPSSSFFSQKKGAAQDGMVRRWDAACRYCMFWLQHMVIVRRTGGLRTPRLLMMRAQFAHYYCTCFPSKFRRRCSGKRGLNWWSGWCCSRGPSPHLQPIQRSAEEGCTSPAALSYTMMVSLRRLLPCRIQ